MSLTDQLAAAKTEVALAGDEINRERAEGLVREIETQLLLAGGVTKSELRGDDEDDA